jgi:hypothetical protein
VSTPADRCSVFRARVERLEQDLADPALAARLAEGSTVITTLVVEDRGESFLLLLLSPPRSPSRRSEVAIGAALATGAALAVVILVLSWSL